MTPERAFVDTNLFLRYFTNDVPQQADLVGALFRRAVAGELALVVSQMVIAEIIWTFESFYHLPRTEIRRHIVAMLPQQPTTFRLLRSGQNALQCKEPGCLAPLFCIRIRLVALST